MNKKKIYIFLVILLLISISSFFFKKFKKQQEIVKKQQEIEKKEEINQTATSHSSNILDEVNFTSKDEEGNIYTLTAKQGEIDFKKNNIIYLKKIKALIISKNSEEISISSDFGKYNTENSDTIFSKNVLITFLDNKISSEYLEFSNKNREIYISKNVILSNLDYNLSADVVEINIPTRNIEIFMLDNLKKIKLKAKN